jgi:hypothetical protein
MAGKKGAKRRTDAEIAAVREAAREELAAHHPMTLRQVHYRLVSRDDIVHPNTESAYKTLSGWLRLFSRSATMRGVERNPDAVFWIALSLVLGVVLLAAALAPRGDEEFRWGDSNPPQEAKVAHEAPVSESVPTSSSGWSAPAPPPSGGAAPALTPALQAAPAPGDGGTGGSAPAPTTGGSVPAPAAPEPAPAPIHPPSQ